MSLKEQLIERLDASRKQVSVLLESVANDQDWQPDPTQWSFRYIAAHLATTENECFLDRVRRFFSESHPRFEYYDNTGRDFSQLELRDSLARWAAARQELIDLVQAMPEHIWLRSATHSRWGTMTVADLLEAILEHDQEHLQEVERMIDQREGDG